MHCAVSFPRRALAVASESDESPPNTDASLRHKPWEFDRAGAPDSSRGSPYTTALQTAADRGAASDCFGIAKQMKKDGVAPTIETYNLLMRAAAQNARTTDAWAILEDMEAVGVQPTALTFNHLINVRLFMVRSCFSLTFLYF